MPELPTSVRFEKDQGPKYDAKEKIAITTSRSSTIVVSVRLVRAVESYGTAGAGVGMGW